MSPACWPNSASSGAHRRRSWRSNFETSTPSKLGTGLARTADGQVTVTLVRAGTQVAQTTALHRAAPQRVAALVPAAPPPPLRSRMTDHIGQCLPHHRQHVGANLVGHSAVD